MNHDKNAKCRTFQNLGENIGEKYLQDLGVGKESLDLMAKKTNKQTKKHTHTDKQANKKKTIQKIKT